MRRFWLLPRVGKIVPLLLLFMLLGAASSVKLAPGDVTSITIDEYIIGNVAGEPGETKVTVTSRNGAFVRDDGTVVPVEQVEALLDALALPPITSFAFSRTGIDRAWLQSRLASAEGALGPAISLPAARSAFDAMYLNPSAMQQWMDSPAYKKANELTLGTPTMRNSRITVVAGARTIEVAESGEIGPYLVPFTITEGANNTYTYDPAISRAVAALLPQGATNRAMLLADALPSRWAEQVAESAGVSAAIARTAVSQPEMQSIAASLGLTLYAMILGDQSSWQGLVARTSLPRLHYAFKEKRTSTLAFRTELLEARATIDRVARVPWLEAGFKREPQDVRIGRDRKLNEGAIAAFRYMGRTQAADALARSGPDTPFVTIHPGGDYSRWLLLSNGDMVLLDFSGHAAFPFGRQWYINQPQVVGPNPDEYLAGVIVHPSATVATAAKGMATGAATWTPSDSEYLALVRLATGTWPKTANAHVVYFAKAPNEMPPFDPIVFYEGVDPGLPSVAWIQENRNDFSTDHSRRLHDALILAAMDTGAAGPNWKRVYDDLKAKDQAQRNPSDPYHYRHAFLATVDAKVAALTPPAPIRTSDPSLDAEASTINDAELGELIKGYFAVGAIVEIQHASLPAGQYAVYRGKNATGRYVVVIDDTKAQQASDTGTTPSGMAEDENAAMFSAIVDSGTAGAAWKQRYDQAPDKARFGRMLARAYDLANQRQIAKSRADVAWIHANVPLGSSRERTIALLTSRALHPYTKQKNITIEFGLGSSIACGRDMAVTLTFDANDRLAKIEDSPESQSCL